jgi:hypothetical protein
MAAYLVHELVWSCVFVIVGVWLLPDGLEGVGKAYLVAYTAYLLTLLWRIRVSHRVRLHWRAVALWAAGWSVVLVASLLTWNTLALDWKGVSSLVCSMLFSWMVLKPNERLYLRRLLLNRFDFGK